MSIQSRIEGDLANENTASQSRIEQILNGEVVAPKSRIEQLLMAYNPEDPGDYHKIECTKEQYDNMTSYDDSTIYVVTYPDESVHFYLGAEEIAGNPSLIEKTITANGTYNASDDGADGYSSVTAAVSDAIKTSYLPNSDPANIIASNAPDALNIMPTSGKWYVPLSAADTDVTCYAVLRAQSDGGDIVIFSVPYAGSEGNLPSFFVEHARSQVEATVYGGNTSLSGVRCDSWHVYTLAINSTAKKVRYYVDGVYYTEKTFTHSGGNVAIGAGDITGSIFAGRNISCRYVGAVSEFEDDTTIIANQQYIMEHVDMT